VVGSVVLSVALALMFSAREADAQTPCQGSDYGMRANASDNIAAFRRMLTECAGRTIHLAEGTYAFRPKDLAPGLVVPASTTIVGDGSQGEHQTVLQIADSGDFNSFFWIRNVSNVTIRQLRFEGTPYDSGCSAHHDYGHAIYIYSDAGQQATVENIEISENTFHNFNGQSWISLVSAEGSPGIGLKSKINVRNNLFISDADLRGGCAATGGLGYPVAMVWIHGANLSAQGLVANVSVASNTFQAGYVKSAVATWSGTQRISIQYNSILDAGLMLPVTPGTDLGRYAILIYNSAHEGARILPGLHPDTIWVVGNTVSNPYSCGIYVASAENIEITGNRITGQRDRYDATLPKGAIALNHASVRALRDNELVNNSIGISTVGSSRISLNENHIVVPPGGVRAKVFP